MTALAVVSLLLSPRPAAAVDSLVIGDVRGQRNWRSIADWGAVENVTVAFDSIEMWDVRPRQNLTPGLRDRGGGVTASYQTVEGDSVLQVSGPVPGLEALADGDGSTAFDPDRVPAPGVPRRMRVAIDLGATYWVDRIRLHPRLDDENRVRYPQVFSVLTDSGGLVDKGVVRVPQLLPELLYSARLPNAEPLVDRTFPSRLARIVYVETGAVQSWELAEVSVFSDDSMPVGVFQSVPVRAGTKYVLFGRVRSDKGPLSQLPVVVQTRSGPDLRPELYYRFTGVGGRLAEVPGGKGQWASLYPEERGPVRPNPEWSDWRTLTDDVVYTAGLHQFVQFRIRFAGPGMSLHRLILEYSQPALANRIEAEVLPRLVAAGEARPFTLSAIAYMRTGSSLTIGFQDLEVRTEAVVHRVTSVAIDDVPVPFRSQIQPGKGFTVHLGRRVDHDAAFLQVRFAATVYRDATAFELSAFDRRDEDGHVDTVYQVARVGDTDPGWPGGDLTVRLTTDAPRTLGQLRASTRVLSPNGDGIHDEVAIGLDVYKVTRATPARVAVFDLAGRRVRRLLDRELGAGHHEVTWDGNDDAGRRVPPGQYLARVVLDAEEGREARIVLVAVAY